MPALAIHFTYIVNKNHSLTSELLGVEYPIVQKMANGRLLFLELFLCRCSITCELPSTQNYQPKVSDIINYNNFTTPATPAFQREIFMQISERYNRHTSQNQHRINQLSHKCRTKN